MAGQSPGRFLEPFDVAVHVGGTELLPDSAELVRQKKKLCSQKVVQGTTTLKNRWIALVGSAPLMTCELLVSATFVSAIQLIGKPKLFA